MSRRPHVIGRVIVQIAQQIGIDRMGGMPLAGAGLAIHRIDPHARHQGAHTRAPDRMALSPQEVPQHSSSSKRIGQMELVDPTHQRQSSSPTPASAGSRPSSETVPGADIAARLAGHGFGRSSLCAQQAGLDERPF